MKSEKHPGFSSCVSKGDINPWVCFHVVFACYLAFVVRFEDSWSEIGNQVDTTALSMLCIHG